MSDSEDFGDFDDDLLEAATKVERAVSAFLPSPRPLKRRRLAATGTNDDIEDDESDIPLVPNVRNGRRKSITVPDSEDDFDPAPFAASISSRMKRKARQAKNPSTTPDPIPPSKKPTPRRRKGSAAQSLTDLDLAAQSTSATSISSTGKKKRARKPKGKEDARDSESPAKRAPKKPKHRIHISTKAINLEDIYATQLPGSDSDPEALRGPVWQKSRNATPNAIGPGQSLNGTSNLPPKGVAGAELSRQRAGNESLGELNGAFVPMGAGISKETALPDKRTPAMSHVSPVSIGGVEAAKLPVPQNAVQNAAFDVALELADLPSDAFDSSSSPQKQDDVIFLSSQVSPARRLIAPQTGLRQTTLFGQLHNKDPVPPSQVNKRYNFSTSQKAEPPTHHKLDRDAMKTWVYPTNLGTIRDYQFNIVARGLLHNLLVALPTGLGKTFIAATIMLNWFRWTQDAQIVFVAPTKPLVSQQVDACFGIAGIPRSQTTLLTGSVSPGLRAEEWTSKRVFFMTPQTIMNDLKTGICDPKRIVLLVVDEAHRATGAYAYVEVVKFIRRFNESFRVLALTATPGADVESVQKVIDGLDISRIEIRTEQSLDIRNYIHSRKIEKHVFENTAEMEMCIELYCKAVQPVQSQLAGQNAFWSKNPLDLTPYGCVQSRQKWMNDAGKNATWPTKNMVFGIFSVLGSLSHSMELLKYHGLGPFYTSLVGFRSSLNDKKNKYATQINDSEPFKQLMGRLQTWVNDDNFIGHPKLEFLQGVILEHFLDAGEGNGPDGAPPSSTRIMVFAHFRDSAEEIVRVLKRNSPMIRPHVFVGQATSKNSEGMDQKMQLEIIHKFKTGVYNTLVATSIGEEGLDIGEVDLIICYDSKASPIRMLQRMGRTGRKRAGKIILLQMKGKEETDAAKAKDNYEKMQEMIANGSRFSFHDERSRRILPKDAQPVVDKRIVDIPLENSQKELPEPKKGRGRAPKRPPKKFHMPDNVRTGFVQVSRMDDEDAKEQVLKRRAKKKVEKKYPSEDPVVLGQLEEVLLNHTQEKDLERRYQTVIDDNDMATIDALNFTAYPDRQRVLAKTMAFRRPGRLTTSVVEMLRMMHRMDDDQVEEFRNNLHRADLGPSVIDGDYIVSDASDSESEVQHLHPTPRQPPAKPCGRPPKTPKAPRTPALVKDRPAMRAQTFRISDLVDVGASSSPPPTDPRMRVPSQAETLGSDTSGSEPEQKEFDSELADFVVDDDEAIPEFSSSLPYIDSFDGSTMKPKASKLTKVNKSSSPPLTEMFYVSQQVLSSDDEEELPDPSTLVSKRLPVDVIEDEDDDAPIVRQRKRVRRVMDDDSDD